MPYRKIDKGLKERAVQLYEHYNWYPDDLADVFGFSERSFYRWLHNFRSHGSVDRTEEPLRGRPHILNAFMMQDLYNLVSEAPDIYLDEIQEWFLIAHDVGISISALHYNLKDAGLTLKIMTKAASERDEARRQEYMDYARNNWVASQLVFVDETSKDDRTIYRHYGRSLIGQKATTQAPFCRGNRYSLVAALTTEGYICERAVEGSVNSIEFNDFIITEVVHILDFSSLEGHEVLGLISILYF